MTRQATTFRWYRAGSFQGSLCGTENDTLTNAATMLLVDEVRARRLYH